MYFFPKQSQPRACCIKSLQDEPFKSTIRDAPTKRFYPSPAAWEDQVLYFLLPDRFSDGNEYGCKDIAGKPIRGGNTAAYTPSANGDAVRTSDDSEKWLNAGGCFTGGNLKGLNSKLGYLKRLGVTAIWIGPVFKQVAALQTYHGYGRLSQAARDLALTDARPGVQNFLDIEPRFGSREELKDLVKTAHDAGIYVILDIILNHSADVFSYDTSQPPGYTGEVYPVKGFWDESRNATIPMADGPIDLSAYPQAWPDGAIWPSELQSKLTFDRKGVIGNDQWDSFPAYIEGDFFDLKDIELGPATADDNFAPSPALHALVDVYKFWLAYLDLDGFRIDTVKHMGDGPTRHFCTEIHEFAMACGKDNFYLIGEIAGDRTFQTVEITGLDAALGIGRVQQTLWEIPKGRCDPGEYFNLFRNAHFLRKGTHAWLRNKVVTMLDDHDQIWRGRDKARFCAFELADVAPRRAVAAVALNLCTLGIPCVYYGTEQAFDGSGGDSDKYIRECMFGGDFGAFRSKARHFFNEDSPTYKQFAAICALRQKEGALRRGRQYLREISINGTDWSLPVREGNGSTNSLVPWSRIFNDRELLCAINTDAQSESTAWVTVDCWLNPSGAKLELLFASEQIEGSAETLEVSNSGGRSVVRLTVPPCGFVVYK